MKLLFFQLCSELFDLFLPSCSVIVMFGKWGEKGGISSDLSSEGFGKSDAKAGEV